MRNISISPIVSGTNQGYKDKTNRLKKLEIEVLSLLMPLSKKNNFKWLDHLQLLKKTQSHCKLHAKELSSCCAWPWLRHSELTFYEFAHPPLIDLLHYCAITLMFITVMTLVIVILMIFFDILVKIRKLKNCNLDKKKIVDFGGRFFFCSVYLLNMKHYEILW